VLSVAIAFAPLAYAAASFTVVMLLYSMGSGISSLFRWLRSEPHAKPRS
jgi:hypothetical protein